MLIVKHLSMMETLHHYIRTKRTGNPDRCAERLGISRRTLYRLINRLKDCGAPINYCRMRECFYYEETFEFDPQEVLKKMMENEI